MEILSLSIEKQNFAFEVVRATVPLAALPPAAEDAASADAANAADPPPPLKPAGVLKVGAPGGEYTSYAPHVSVVMGAAAPQHSLFDSSALYSPDLATMLERVPGREPHIAAATRSTTASKIATQQPRIPNAFSALPAERVEKDPMLDPSMWSSGNHVRLKTKGTHETRMSATDLKGFTSGDLLHFLLPSRLNDKSS